ncbi:SusC/RagA family TonB-linked outer membrane protein [Bacteroidia bacterium]|nr:SusC/RagA family TonB-linked outer membrane protein [Bacteroidia bacterium]
MKKSTNRKKLGLCLAAVILVMAAPGIMHAQSPQKALEGTVVDQSGMTLPGVNVVKKGTSTGTITDIDGKFSLPASAAQETLTFSYIGYKPEEKLITAGVPIRIEMQEATSVLDEVVVVGYGTQKKVSVTASLSSIKSEDLLRTPVSNVSSALVGKSTGLFAVQRSGEPGKDNADIYIRGIATFAGSNATKPLILIDGIEREMNSLDPNEIESVNILKDASATAIFGVRGANGVIIITTKTGSEGKPTVNITSNFAIQNPIRLPELLDAYEWAYWRNVANKNDFPNTAVPFSEQDLEYYKNGQDPVFHPNNNWFDLMLKKYIPQQQHNLSVSGGTKLAKYYVSLGLLSQDGAFKDGSFFKDFSANSKYNRYNIRANTDFQWTKIFSTSVKFGTQITDANYAGVDATSIMNQVFINNPISSPVIVNDKLIWNVAGLGAWQNGNPPLFQLLDNGYSTNFSSRMNIDVSGVLKLDFITKGFSLRGKIAYDSYYNQQVKRRRQVELYDIKQSNPANPTEYALVISQYSGVMSVQSEAYSKNRKIYGEAAMDYNRTFGNHTLTGLVLGTMERYYSGANELPYNYMGLVGRVTYNYANRYLAEFNVGYNGSENFAPKHQFGVFPAFSLGYNISEEDFFPKDGWVSFLKLRGSVGLVGNDKIQGVRFLFTPSTFTNTNNIYYFGTSNTAVSGYRESVLGNPDVTWETALKENIGLDMQLFNNSLRLVADVFKEERKDILWNLNVPVTFGSASLVAPYNIGQAENKGFELEFGYNGKIENWGLTYYLNANYSFARNKIIYMDEVPQPYANLVRTGQRINQPFGLICEGFYNYQSEIDDPSRPVSAWEGSGLRPGDLKYKDVNKDGKIDDNDLSPIGYTNIPEIIYGISGGLKWKGLDFSILFQGSDHVSTYISGTGATPFRSGNGTAFANVIESWSIERYESGLPVTLPRLSAAPNDAAHNYRTSGFWQQDARYLRLKNMEIGYNLASIPKIKKAGLRSIRLYLSGQNLLTWTPMRWFDPEIVANTNGGVYPMTRIMSVGINIQY